MPACVREEEMQNIMPGGLKTNMERRKPLSSTSSTGRMPPGRGDAVVEGNLKISFRSVLELLKLIDSTFEIGNAETTLAHG